MMYNPAYRCGPFSNLCTEITLNTCQDEIAVCNLGSVNLPQHIDENGLNPRKVRENY